MAPSSPSSPPPPPSTSAFPPPAVPPQQPQFLFSSLSSIWRSLRVEATGFLRAAAAGGPERDVEEYEAAEVGGKRTRNEGRAQQLEDARREASPGSGRGSKRRKREREGAAEAPPVPARSPSNFLAPSPGPSKSKSKETRTPRSRSPRVNRSHASSSHDGFRGGEVGHPSSSSPVAQRSSLADHSRRQLGAPSSSTSAQKHHVHFTFPASLPSSSSMPNLSALSPSVPLSRTSSAEQVDTILLGPNASEVSRAWREARDEERRVRRVAKVDKQEESERSKERERIRELEEEVRRLKDELSAQKHRPSPSSPRSPFKPTSAPPPPPPPAPPPPPGVPNVPGAWRTLTEARASLRSTPPRPSAGSGKRRMSSIGGAEGGGLDMNKFLGEMKGFKLRKVVQPPREKERGTKGAGGEMQDVLQQAFKRKFAKAHDLHDISSPQPNALGRPNPTWSSPRPAPPPPPSTSSLAPPPAQPSFLTAERPASALSRPDTDLSASQYSTDSIALPLPLDSNGGVIGGALSTDDQPQTHSAQDVDGELEMEIPSPPAELVARYKVSPYLPASGMDFPLPPPAAVSELDLLAPKTPARPSTSSTSARSPHAREEADATHRLSLIRQPSNPTPPDSRVLNYSRPITPGRKKARTLLLVERQKAAEAAAKAQEGKENVSAGAGIEKEEKARREGERRKAQEQLEGMSLNPISSTTTTIPIGTRDRIPRSRPSSSVGKTPRAARRLAQPQQPQPQPQPKSVFESDEEESPRSTSTTGYSLGDLPPATARLSSKLMKKLRSSKGSTGSSSSIPTLATALVATAEQEEVEEVEVEMEVEVDEYFGVGEREKDPSRVIGWGVAPTEEGAEGGSGKEWALTRTRREGGEWEGWELKRWGEEGEEES